MHKTSNGLQHVLPDSELLLRRLLAFTLGDRKHILHCFMDDLGLSPQFELTASIVHTRPAHPTAICNIARSAWYTSEIIVGPEKTLVIPDSTWHFNIAWQVQVQSHPRRIDLHLRYETNPYCSVHKLNTRADAQDVAEYHVRRAEFYQLFVAACNVPGFRPVFDLNQIGKVDDFSGKTVAEAREFLSHVILSVSNVVSQVLGELHRRRMNRLDIDHLKRLHAAQEV